METLFFFTFLSQNNWCVMLHYVMSYGETQADILYPKGIWTYHVRNWKKEYTLLLSLFWQKFLVSTLVLIPLDCHFFKKNMSLQRQVLSSPVCTQCPSSLSFSSLRKSKKAMKVQENLPGEYTCWKKKKKKKKAKHKNCLWDMITWEKINYIKWKI